MATFVLVHGGGHGGWCYKKLARLLREAGHDVHTPTLTGLGERKHLLSANTCLSTHIADVVNLIDYEDLSDVILCGHSYGGMVITGVGDRIPERIRELVYLDAAHPKNGQSLVDVAPTSMAFARSSSRTVDGIELVMWPNDEVVAAMGATDPEDIAWLKAKMDPHPWKCFEEKLHFINGDAVLELPRTDVGCSISLRNSTDKDRVNQTSGHRQYEIDTGHDLMVTEPEKVAQMLLDVAAG